MRLPYHEKEEILCDSFTSRHTIQEDWRHYIATRTKSESALCMLGLMNRSSHLMHSVIPYEVAFLFLLK